MNELKPCPHCGKTETLEFATCRENEDCPNFDDCDAEKCKRGACDYFDNWDCVVCSVIKSGCGATGGYASCPVEAVEKWNTRADDNEEVTTCLNCGAQIDMLGMFTPLAKSSVLYRHYATYCPACGERLVD